MIIDNRTEMMKYLDQFIIDYQIHILGRNIREGDLSLNKELLNLATKYKVLIHLVS